MGDCGILTTPQLPENSHNAITHTYYANHSTLIRTDMYHVLYARSSINALVQPIQDFIQVTFKRVTGNTYM